MIADLKIGFAWILTLGLMVPLQAEEISSAMKGGDITAKGAPTLA